MTKQEGLLKLTEIIRRNLTHRDYERVTKLAETYYKMVSGDGVADLLQQIVKRETPEEFEMRKTITNSIIPPTLALQNCRFKRQYARSQKRGISRGATKTTRNERMSLNNSSLITGAMLHLKSSLNMLLWIITISILTHF